MKKMKEVLHRSAALLLAFVLIASMGTQFRASAYEEQTGKVIATTLYVRSGPGTTYDKLGYLKQNATVTIVGEDHASDGALWYKIRYGGGYGFVSAKFVEANPINKDDPDFEVMLEQFPESYRQDLRRIHAQYPNWIFKPVFTHTNWADAMKAESALKHSLVHASSISSWKSTKPGAYDWETGTWIGFDGPSWVQASDEILAYYLDPRNYLDSEYIFTFLDYSYDASQNKEGLSNIVKGTFMEGGFTENGQEYTYVDVIMDAAQRYRMNPYVLATIIRNELGVNGSNSISGTVPGYEGYYNYYNIGAYATSTMTAIERGLWYAKGGSNGATSFNRPWDNRYDAVLGGANFYASNYVGQGQNTVYLKKFNVIGSDKHPPYTHEYMTNVTGAASEGRILAKAYSEAARAEKLIFEIPVYDNMPATAAPKPTGDGSPNNKLSDLTVSQSSLNPIFDKDTQNYDLVLDAGVGEITISATALDSTASIEGTGTFTLQDGDNTFDVTVTAQNGQKRVYSLHVVADFSVPEWKLDENGWRYEYPDGSFEVDRWALIEGAWYHFDARGYMQTGWQQIDGKRYYLTPSGAMVTGWYEIEGGWYYFNSLGHMLTGWQQIGDHWFYLTSDGPMVTGWQEIAGKRYYFNGLGHMLTGWLETDGQRYYLASNGSMVTGWQEIAGKRYYFDGLGHMQTGWQEMDGQKYYLTSDGSMAIGWQEIENKRYYFDGLGHMQTGWQEMDGQKYYLTSDGSMAIGWQEIENKRYYFDGLGHMQTGWQEMDGQKYYLTSDGSMAIGWQEIEGKRYYFNTDGTMAKSTYIDGEYIDENGVAGGTPVQTGWQSDEKGWCYNDANGERLTGWQQIGGFWFYFTDNGYMQTGWQRINGNWFYLDENGHMLTGWQRINGNWFYLNGSGHMLTGWQLINGNWFYLNGSGHMLTGWQKINDLWYYFNSIGYMQTGWQWIDGKCYYFYESGYMATSTWIGGSYVDSSGAWVQ